MKKVSDEVVNALLNEVSAAHDADPEHVRGEIEALIDAAMEGDAEKRATMAAMVGHEGRPTVEELLVALSAHVPPEKGGQRNN